MTLLNVQIPSPVPDGASVYDSGPPRRLLVYFPLAVAVILILLPHPSWLIMLSSHYLKMHRVPVAFWLHLLAAYFLTFMTFSSLIICVVRDPGSVIPTSPRKTLQAENDDEEEANVALLEDEDQDVDMCETKSAGRWCRRCKLRRPERAHHCSTCGRCVLKMDHHCPWLGGNCVGYRTYPSFLHFLFSTTLLAVYMTSVALSIMVQLISDPFLIDPHVTPLHCLFLVLMGAIFALTIGSFLLYHVYLVSTNQTTLEHMSPFLLLRYLPELPGNTDNPTPALYAASSEPVSPPYPQTHPPSKRYPPLPAAASSPKRRPPPLPSSYSRLKISTELADPPTPTSQSTTTSPLWPSPPDSYPLHTTPPYAPPPSPPAHSEGPPEEHELSSAQRRLVQHTHGKLRPYDLGFRANWAQVFGGRRHGWAEWARLVLWGGSPSGDGRVFARGPSVRPRLERLARELDAIRRQERRGS